MEFLRLNNHVEHEYKTRRKIISLLVNEKGESLLRSDLRSKVSDQDVMNELNNSPGTDEVKKLPEIGEPLEEGVLYTYSTEEESFLIKCRQAHDRTIYDIADIPALFSFYRGPVDENGDPYEWIQNEEIQEGWERVYDGVTYEVIQPHMTVEEQTPDVAPALWNVVSDSEEWTIGVAYTVDDIVTYNGNTYKCLQSHTSQTGWNPEATPALWEIQS